MAGVILTKRFVAANTKKFQSYVDYIDRDEAVKKEKFTQFSLYNDYMDNPNKLGGLFTLDKDFLSDEEKKDLKTKFAKAQSNNSIMWQDVISFENEWLEKHGLYDSKTKTLDEKKLMEATRSMMKVAEEKEKLNNYIWSASFHFNTDNIHIHIASLEMIPNENRRTLSNEIKGRFKPQTLTKMKSKFVNTLLDRQQSLDRINQIIRENIIKNRPDDIFSKDKKMKELVLDIIKDLPKNRNHWQYGYNSINRKKIDLLTDYYIETYKKEDFNELKKSLKEQENILKEIYGSGKNENYKNYYRTKIDDLHKRMGNSFLKEIKYKLDTKEYNHKLNEIPFNKSDKNIRNSANNKFESKAKNSIFFVTQKDINNIKKIFNKDMQSIKNQRDYEKLNKDKKVDNEYER